MARLPGVFVSHGAPSLLLDDTPTRSFLAGLGASIGRPRGIVCVSAHWEASRPTVTASASPATLCDFYGFPAALYAMRYPAPGDPALARRVASLLAAAGLDAEEDPSRGFDHGAWVPLTLMYPGADVPVVQLSVQSALGAAHHLEMGRALAPLRDEGVLVLGSGGATHDLRGFFGHALDDAPEDYAREFDGWLRDAVVRGDDAALAAWAERAPHARRNHPTAEHFLPLLVPAGSAGRGARGRVLHAAFEFGVLSMAAFAWD